MRSFQRLLAASILTVVFVSGAPAQVPDTSVVSDLERIRNGVAASREGKLLNRSYGRLPAGGVASHPVSLTPGMYLVSASGSAECKEIHLVVYRNDALIEYSQPTALRTAGLIIEVPAAAVYELEVRMRKCSVDACNYGFQVVAL